MQDVKVAPDPFLERDQDVVAVRRHGHHDGPLARVHQRRQGAVEILIFRLENNIHLEEKKSSTSTNLIGDN